MSTSDFAAGVVGPDGGVVDVIHTPDGEATYRFCGGTARAHHHHLVCRRCGRTEEIEGRVIERWADEVAERYGAERGYGLASYVDGLQSAGRVEEALALTEQSVAAARKLGNPYWVAYALWIAGMAFSRTNTRRALAAWEDITPLARNEWICWTISVKKEETRRQHIERVSSELKEGMRRPCCWPGCGMGRAGRS